MSEATEVIVDPGGKSIAEMAAEAERARLLKLAEEMAEEATRKRKGLRKQSTASQDLRVTANVLREFIRRASEPA